MKIKIRTPASAGELLEGQVNGIRQLISLPINVYNELTIYYEQHTAHEKGCASENIISANLANLTNHSKAKAAMQLFYQTYHINPSEYALSFFFNDVLIIGKGLASSTADIVNMICGLAFIYEIKISPIEIAKMAIQIEPSDSTMFNELYLCDFIHGTRFEKINKIPSFDILLLELPNVVDSVETYSQKDFKGEKNNLDDVLDDIRADCSIKNLSKAAIKSALNHQLVMYKPYLNQLIEFTHKHNLLGLNIAHSGSFIGLWCHAESTNQIMKETISQNISDEFKNIFISYAWVKTVAGGSHYS